MKEYHKIPVLWKFDKETKKYIKGMFYDQSVLELRKNRWLFTEKIDGMNFRIHWDGHSLQYAGRTDSTMFSAEQIEFIEKELVNEEKETIFEQTFQDKVVTVYGELFGNKIQNGGDYTEGKGLAFRVFDIEINDVFFRKPDMIDLCDDELGYDSVGILFYGTIEQGLKYVEKNDKSTYGTAKLEGLVGTPVGDFRDRLGKRIIVKIKKRDV